MSDEWRDLEKVVSQAINITDHTVTVDVLGVGNGKLSRELLKRMGKFTGRPATNAVLSEMRHDAIGLLRDLVAKGNLYRFVGKWVYEAQDET